MTVPVHAQGLWSEYLSKVGDAAADRFYEAFGFGDSPAMADELGALVVAGIKRATAGAVWAYESAGQRLPRPGDLSVVLDAANTPLCIIETLQVDLVAFGAVTAEFAAVEGEGDGSLAYWRQAHREYFTKECERAGRPFSTDMLLACERFRVVYPLPGESG